MNNILIAREIERHVAAEWQKLFEQGAQANTERTLSVYRAAGQQVIKTWIARGSIASGTVVPYVFQPPADVPFPAMPVARTLGASITLHMVDGSTILAGNPEPFYDLTLSQFEYRERLELLARLQVAVGSQATTDLRRMCDAEIDLLQAVCAYREHLWEQWRRVPRGETLRRMQEVRSWVANARPFLSTPFGP